MQAPRIPRTPTAASVCTCGAPGTAEPSGEVTLRRGQLALRRRDDEVVEVRAVLTHGYFLSDGSWVCTCELEDPLREGRLRDLRRGAAAEARRRAVEQGDFGAMFPRLQARREARRWSAWLLPLVGWLLAVLEAALLIVVLVN